MQKRNANLEASEKEKEQQKKTDNVRHRGGTSPDSRANGITSRLRRLSTRTSSNGMDPITPPADDTVSLQNPYNCTC